MKKNAACRKALEALVLLISLPLCSNAGLITFVDLTDNLTIQDTTGRIFTQSCFLEARGLIETCDVILNAPPIAVSSDISSLSLEFSEPGTNISSDKISLGRNLILQKLEIIFQSPGDDAMPIPCGPCIGPETGGVQTAFTIHWLDIAGTIVDSDTIQFQSDTSEVPEPSTALLLLTGLALQGFVSICRRALSEKSKNTASFGDTTEAGLARTDNTN